MVRFNGDDSAMSKSSYTTFQEDIQRLFSKDSRDRTKRSSNVSSPLKVYPAITPIVLNPPPLNEIFKDSPKNSQNKPSWVKDLDDIVLYNLE